MLDLSKKRELEIKFKNIDGDEFSHKGTITAKFMDLRASLFLKENLQSEYPNDLEVTVKLREILLKEFLGEAWNTYETVAKKSRELLDQEIFEKIQVELDKLEKSITAERNETKKTGK